MLDGKARTADATAVAKDAGRCRWGRPQWIGLLESNRSAFARGHCFDFVCARLREADMQLEGVALHRIEVRLARFLLGHL